MLLKWVSGISAIEMIMSDGTELTWPAKLWSRSGDVVNSTIFDIFNDYWKQQSRERVKRTEALYLELHKIFSNLNSYRENVILVTDLINQILSMYDWNSFRLWCLLHGKMELTIGIKDTLGDKDKSSITYFTHEYDDLVVLSVLLKAVMPIWGSFEYNMRGELGKDHTQMVIVDLLRKGPISKLTPFLKLEDYVKAFTEERISTPGFSLTCSVGTEEIPEYLTAVTLIKKVIIFNGREIDKSIVTNIFHLLKQRCKGINKDKPNSKLGIDENGSELTVTDRYKIIQPIAPGIVRMVEEYSLDIPRMIKDIDSTISVSVINKRLLEITSSVPSTLEINDYHTPIIAAVCNTIINKRSIRLVNYETTIRLIYTSVILLEHWGLDSLAILIITPSEMKDIYKISLSGSSKNVLNLPEDLSNQLKEIYKYTEDKTPGHTLIDRIAKDVNRNNWPVRSGTFDLLRSHLAMLLIKISLIKTI